MSPGGWTACHAAAEAGSHACVNALLSVSPSFAMQSDDGGDTPAKVANTYGYFELSAVLESHEESQRKQVEAETAKTASERESTALSLSSNGQDESVVIAT